MTMRSNSASTARGVTCYHEVFSHHDLKVSSLFYDASHHRTFMLSVEGTFCMKNVPPGTQQIVLWL